MSRKNKTLRAFLHQNKNPTIEQAWDHAWKYAQKEFHARSMQDLESKNDRLVEALRDAIDCCEMQDMTVHGITDGYIEARALLAQLDTKGEE